MKKIIKMTLCFLTAFVLLMLISCSVASTGSGQIDDEKNDLSPLASDATYRDSIHLIRNSETNTEMIVKGDGTILLKTMRPGIEYLDTHTDAKTNEIMYLSKSVEGDEVEEYTSYNEFSGETYKGVNPIRKMTFYDRNGDEIGLATDTYSPALILGNKIFYTVRAEDKDYYYEDLYMYDVDAKKSEKVIKNRIGFFNSRILLSSDGYSVLDRENGIEEVLICDENLNVEKVIEGYSFANVIEKDDVKIVKLMKTVVKNADVSMTDRQYGVDYSYKYNYLDKDFNLIFDEPVDANIYFDNSTTVTINNESIEFDYDFKNLKKVSEDRVYKGYTNAYDEDRVKKEVYRSAADKVKSKDNKYNYVEIEMYNDKVLLFAYYSDDVDYTKVNIDEYDFKNHCDIYTIDGDLIKQFDNVNFVYEEDGYIFVDNSVVYDFGFNVIKTFDEEINIERKKKGDFIYFTDNSDKHYNSREKYNIYDRNFNVLYDNIICDNPYSFDGKYLLIAGKGYTRLVDENLKVFKEYDKAYDIHDWYDTKYMIVENLESGRMGVMDDNFNIIINDLKSVTNLEEKSFTYTNGFRYGLMDYDGKVICDFSIFDTMTEDANLNDYKIKYVE